MKIRGFIFSRKPTVEAQVLNLVRKAKKIFFVHLCYQKAGIPQEFFLGIYQSVVRSVLDYSSVVYHSRSAKQIPQQYILENTQKKYSKAIYGYNLTYVELLEHSDLERLSDRREATLEIFAN